MADNELGQMTMALSNLDNIPYKTPKIIQFDDQVNRYYQYWECVVYRKDDTNSPIDFEICLGDLTTGGPSVTVNAGFKLSITDTLVTYTEYDNSTSGATTNSNTVTDLKDIIDLIKNDDTDNLCVLSILLHPRCNLEPEGNTQGNAVTQFTDWSGLYLYINKRIVNGTKPNSPFIMKIPNTSLSNFSIAINTKQNSVLQFQWNFNNDEFIYPELAMQCYEELSIHNSEEIPSKWFTVPYDMNNLDYYAQKKNNESIYAWAYRDT